MNEKILAWIQAHLERGDMKEIHARLPGVKYETVRAVLNGVFYGVHGDAVVKAAVDFIAQKLEKLLQEQKKVDALEKRYNDTQRMVNIKHS